MLNNNSSYYGLSNPAFTQDIGYGTIDAMYPSLPVDKVSGTVDLEPSEAAKLINNGQPSSDTYQTKPQEELKRDKQNKFVKKALIGLGAAAVAALAFFKFKTPVLNASSKVAGFAKNMWTAIKSIPTKISSIFKKTTSP